MKKILTILGALISFAAYSGENIEVDDIYIDGQLMYKDSIVDTIYSGIIPNKTYVDNVVSRLTTTLGVGQDYTSITDLLLTDYDYIDVRLAGLVNQTITSGKTFNNKQLNLIGTFEGDDDTSKIKIDASTSAIRMASGINYLNIDNCNLEMYNTSNYNMFSVSWGQNLTFKVRDSYIEGDFIVNEGGYIVGEFINSTIENIGGQSVFYNFVGYYKLTFRNCSIENSGGNEIIKTISETDTNYVYFLENTTLNISDIDVHGKTKVFYDNSCNINGSIPSNWTLINTVDTAQHSLTSDSASHSINSDTAIYALNASSSDSSFGTVTGDTVIANDGITINGEFFDEDSIAKNSELRDTTLQVLSDSNYATLQDVSDSIGGTIQNANLSIQPRNEGIVTGNARGAYAIDLQLQKGSSSEIALGDNSVLIGGQSSRATGNHSASIGGDSDNASGNNSITLAGIGNTTNGVNSLAMGTTNTANDYCESVLGHYATTSSGNSSSIVSTNNLLKVGNGTSAGSVSDAFIVKANGLLWIKDRWIDFDTISGLYTASGAGITLNGSNFELGDSILKDISIKGNGTNSLTIGESSVAEVPFNLYTNAGTLQSSNDFSIVAGTNDDIYLTTGGTTGEIIYKAYIKPSGNTSDAFGLPGNLRTDNGSMAYNSSTDEIDVYQNGATEQALTTATEEITATKLTADTNISTVNIFAGDTMTVNWTLDSALGSVGIDSIRFLEAKEEDITTKGVMFFDSTTQGMSLKDPAGYWNISQELGEWCYNPTGSQIDDGDIVRITGNHLANGYRYTKVELAGNTTWDSSMVLGAATMDIPAGDYGRVTYKGRLNFINTTGLSGTYYLGNAGEKIDTSPPPPYISVCLGSEIHEDNDSGIVFFNPQMPQYSPEPVYSTAFNDSAVTITINTQNVYENITNGTGNLFTERLNYGFKQVGDSIRALQDGIYFVHFSYSFYGDAANNDNWDIGIFKNGVKQDKKLRTSSTTSRGGVTMQAAVSLTTSDWITVKIRNRTTGTRDPVLVDGTINIEFNTRE